MILLQRIAFCLAIILLPFPAKALDLGSGTLPITHMATPPAKIGPDDAIEIAGTVRGGSANIVLRIDDKWGAAFADRFNGEKTLAPGPFKWVVPASEIKAPSGRVLDLGMIRQFVLFVTSGGTVEVTTFRAAGAGVDIPTAGASGAAAVKPGAAAPASLPAGRGTMRFEPNDPVDGSGRQLVVEGRIEGSESIGVLLRIDDLQSKDYPSRVGIERTIPAGPFRFQTGIEGLRTPNGRTIDARTIRRIVFGAYPDNRNVVVTRFDLVDAKGLADGAIGYALGAMEATLPTGFQRISPGMRAFQGRQLPQ